MADNPEQTAQLQQEAAAMVPDFRSSEQQPEGEPTQEPATESAPQAEAAPQATSEPAKQPDGQADKTANLKKIFDETPYKADDIEESAKKIVEGYKSIESEFTKTRTKIKPVEAIVDAANVDPNFKQFLEQAYTIYKNPQLAQAYVTPQGQVDAPPNPAQYDLYTPEGLTKFNQDNANYMQRQLDSRINARLAESEQRTRLETHKGEFVRRYPNAVTDPDAMMRDVQAQAATMNPYEAAYKISQFDNIASKALETARKELQTKIETAQSAKTPASASTPTSKPVDADIINHFLRYGSESAIKKYGRDVAMQAIERNTNATMGWS